MNNETFLIEEIDLDTAKNVCKFINNPNLRNRAVANVTASNIARKYFVDLDVDVTSGLHKVCKVLEDYEIADVYLKDNYIDVRLYFEDNALFVPKSHFDNDLLPVAYMFIKIDENLTSGEVAGFVIPSEIDKSNEQDGYYRVLEENLVSVYDIESRLDSIIPDKVSESFESDIFNYLDGKLEDKKSFYKALLSSREARIKLQNAEKTKLIFDFISIPSADVSTDKSAVEEEVLDTLEEAPLDEIEETSGLAESNGILLEEDSLGLLEEATDLDIDSPEDVYDEVSKNNETLELEEELGLELESEELLSEETLEELEILDETATAGEDEEEDVDNAEDNDVESFDEKSLESSLDIDTDKVSMLNVGVYEESHDEFEVDNFEFDSESDISIVDSSKLVFGDDNDAIKVDFSTPAIEEDSAAFEVVEDLADAVESEKSEEVEFPTTVTPSLDIDEEDSFEEELPQNYEEEVQTVVEEVIEPVAADEPVAEEEAIAHEEENTEQIDTLFTSEESTQEIPVETDFRPKRNKLVPVVFAVAVLAVIGFYGYSKFAENKNVGNEIADVSTSVATEPVENEDAPSPDEAMPVETVENLKLDLNTSEGRATTVPAIEGNLDASIAVSNLRVEFEIPSAYKTSKSAERYFTKMGKILQLNLKTELLLLTRQPVTNKIALELEFNDASQKFEARGFVATSGDAHIDDIIMQTVKSALNINLNMNMSTFANVKENPVLIIRL